MLSNSAMAANVDSLIIKESDSDMVLSKLSHLEQEIYEHRLREAYYTDVIGTNVSYCCAIIGLLGLTVGGLAFFSLSKTKRDCIRETEKKIKEYSDSQEEFKSTVIQASKAAYYAAYTIIPLDINKRIADCLKDDGGMEFSRILVSYWEGLYCGINYLHIKVQYENQVDDHNASIIANDFNKFTKLCEEYKIKPSFTKEDIIKGKNALRYATEINNTSLIQAIVNHIASMEEIIQLEDSSSEVSSK